MRIAKNMIKTENSKMKNRKEPLKKKIKFKKPSINLTKSDFYT